MCGTKCLFPELLQYSLAPPFPPPPPPPPPRCNVGRLVGKPFLTNNIAWGEGGGEVGFGPKNVGFHVKNWSMVEAVHSASLSHIILARILEQHFAFLSKKGKVANRSALAEHSVNHEVAGKKGGKNKFQYRQWDRNSCDRAEADAGQGYTQIHHNDHPFTLQMLSGVHKSCKSCDRDFCHKRRIIPFDLVVSHPERWYYPVNGDWSNKRATTRETTRYYHASQACILKRFPYFSADEYLEIPPNTAALLKESHRAYLSAEFGVSVDP